MTPVSRSTVRSPQDAASYRCAWANLPITRNVADTNRRTGLLPLRNYSDEYVALVGPVLKALDALDIHLRRQMNDLQNQASLKHAEAAAHLDTK